MVQRPCCKTIFTPDSQFHLFVTSCACGLVKTLSFFLEFFFKKAENSTPVLNLISYLFTLKMPTHQMCVVAHTWNFSTVEWGWHTSLFVLRLRMSFLCPKTTANGSCQTAGGPASTPRQPRKRTRMTQPPFPTLSKHPTQNLTWLWRRLRLATWNPCLNHFHPGVLIKQINQCVWSYLAKM